MSITGEHSAEGSGHFTEQEISEKIQQISMQAELEGMETTLIEEQLDNYGIQRIIDNDPEVEMKLYHQFRREFEQQKETELYWRGEREMFDDAEAYKSWVAVEGMIAYQEELEFQRLIVKTLAWLQYVFAHPEQEGLSLSDVSQLKKTFQAEFYMHYGIKMKDPWQRLIDETIAVEGLDMGRDEDQMYFDDAKASKPLFDLEMQEKTSAVREAAYCVGLYSIDADDAGGLTAVIIGMQKLASMPNYEQSIQGRAARNKALFEWSASNAVRERYGMRMLITLQEFFDDRYPIPASA